MKKILILLIAALVVITISCSDKGSGGGSSSGFPTIPTTDNWAWPQLGINTMLSIWQGQEKDNLVELEILHFSDNVPKNCVLKINNNTIATPDSSEWDYDYWYVDSLHIYECYYYWIDSYDVPELANILAGQNVSYSVKINNTTDAGSLKIPYQIYCSYPDFDFEQDFHFVWTIQENPALHYVFLDIWDWNWSNYLRKNWKLSGGAREYTISKSIYQDLVGMSNLWVWCGVEAINYNRNGDFLALSETMYYYDEGWKSDSTFDRKLHRERLLKALLGDIDKL